MKKTYTYSTITDRDARNLKKLNALYNTMSRLSNRLPNAEDPEAVIAEFKEVSAEFDKLRRNMPPVKFDMKDGRYFISRDCGDEVFVVRVRRVQDFFVYEGGRTREEALDRARRHVAEDNAIPLGELEAEDWSR